MSSACPNSESGFTLLEVLIVMIILVFISIGIYEATTSSFMLRDVLTVEGDFYNSIRLSMGVFERDVSMVYSPVIMVPPKPTPSPGAPPPPPASADPAFQQLMQTDAGTATTYWLPAVDKSGIRPSHFIGSDSKITFISDSHIRVYKNSPESEFAKIAFELRKDENKDLPDTQMLVTIENTDVFDTDEARSKPFEQVFPLLHGIRKLTFSYWRKDKDKPERSWDSDKEDMKGLFPDKIIIDMEVIGTQKLSYTGHYVFRPEIPLNGLIPQF
ncbi:MAG: PulJ/GspJ family protein [Bdellovibrionota bacterium]